MLYNYCMVIKNMFCAGEANHLALVTPTAINECLMF